MTTDARRAAETALLLAIQQRLREPGSEFGHIELRGTGAASLLRTAGVTLLPEATAPAIPPSLLASASTWENRKDARAAPPVCRRLNDPSIVSESHLAAEQLYGLDSPELSQIADSLSERASARVHAAFLNHLVLDLLDLELEYNLSPNQAWMLYLGTLGDVVEGRTVQSQDWHEAMVERLHLVIRHETAHPRALMPFHDRSMTDGVVLLKFDKHYDEASWLQLHALLDDLSSRPIRPKDSMWLFHEAWNDDEFLLAAVQIEGKESPSGGKSPSGWVNDWDSVERLMLTERLFSTTSELGRYVTNSDRLMLGGRVLVAAGDLSDWFQLPGDSTAPASSPSFSFGQLRLREVDGAAKPPGPHEVERHQEALANLRAEEPSSEPLSEVAESPIAHPKSGLASSLEDAVTRRDGGPASTFRADTAIVYVQARAILGKSGLLRVRQVTVDSRDDSGPTLSVTVEKDVPRSQALEETVSTRRHDLELANWSGWHAILQSPAVSQESEFERADGTPRRSAVLWEGVMTLDQGTELTRAALTDRLEDLLHRLASEGFILAQR